MIVGAFDRDKSASGHSLTMRETISVSLAEIDGATAYEVSGMEILFYSSFCG